MKKLGLASICTIGGFFALLAIILIVIFTLTGIPFYWGLIISLAFLILQFLIGPVITDLTMKWFYKVDFNYQMPKYVVDFIDETCKNHNMKYPKVGFINDGAPNAFTYGRVKNDARIVLTKGIFDMLSEDEVKAVIAHEIGHASHYDMLLMTVVQIIPLILYGIARVTLGFNSSSSSSSSSKSSSSSGNAQSIAAIIGLICLVLYVISEYVILWLSRCREYYADEFSAQETKKPNDLASALVKIGLGLNTVKRDEKIKHPAGDNTTLGISDTASSKATVASCIDEDGNISKDLIKKGMRWDMFNIWAKWYELNATHPLTSKRILKLSSYSKEYNQEPYIVFDEERPKGMGSRFFCEVLIHILPWLAFIGVIVTAIIAFVNWPVTQSIHFVIPAIVGIVGIGLSFMKFIIRYPKKFEVKDVSELLTDVTASDIHTVPCELIGTIVGRGDPGCVFNENYVMQDDTGIVLLNYKQPLKTLNKIFALFFSKKNLGKPVHVKGWYRRNPVPYVEMLSYEIDGQQKKLYKYTWGWVWRFLILAALIILLFI